MKADISLEVERILNHLVSSPEFSIASADKSVVKEMMLKTDGRILSSGKQWDIRAKPLGAGVYRLSLIEVKP